MTPEIVGREDDLVMLCIIALSGATFSLVVGGRAVVGYQTRLRPTRALAAAESLLQNVDPGPMAEAVHQRAAWMIRLHNPLAQLLLTTVIVQLLQALHIAALSLVAMVWSPGRCLSRNRLDGSNAVEIHVITADLCEVSAVVDQFFDNVVMLLVAWFLALVAIPKLHCSSGDRAPSGPGGAMALGDEGAGVWGRRAVFIVAWATSLVGAAAWTVSSWFVLPKPTHPGAAKFRRWLPWCFAADSEEHDSTSWEATRLGTACLGIFLYVVLGALASFRLRRALRQYRRAVTHRWPEQQQASPLASFVRSGNLPRRLQLVTLAYVAVLVVNAAWRLIPLSRPTNVMVEGFLTFLIPCSAGFTAFFWAVCDGTFVELYGMCVPGPLRCIRIKEVVATDAEGRAVPNAYAHEVLEPLPFTHIVLTANRFAQRWSVERRWLHQHRPGYSSGSEDDGISPSRYDEPSVVNTVGPAPVP